MKTTTDKLVDGIERLQKQLDEAHDEARKAREQSMKAVEPIFDEGGVRAYWFDSAEDMSPDGLKLLADTEANTFGEEARLVIGAIAGSAFVAKSSNGWVAAGGHVGNLVKEHGKAHNIRGGGREQFVQGKAPPSKDDLLGFAKELVSHKPTA